MTNVLGGNLKSWILKTIITSSFIFPTIAKMRSHRHWRKAYAWTSVKFNFRTLYVQHINVTSGHWSSWRPVSANFFHFPPQNTLRMRKILSLYLQLATVPTLKMWNLVLIQNFPFSNFFLQTGSSGKSYRHHPDFCNLGHKQQCI